MKIELTFEKKTPKGYFVYKGEVIISRTIEVEKTVGRVKKWVEEVQNSPSLVKIYAKFEVSKLRIDEKDLETMRKMSQNNVIIPNFYWF